MNDGGPAFPRTVKTTTILRNSDGETEIPVSYDEPGLSIRDWFAGQADTPPYEYMCRVLNTDSPYEAGVLEISRADAAWRYAFADAMLAQRSKQ